MHVLNQCWGRGVIIIETQFTDVELGLINIMLGFINIETGLINTDTVSVLIRPVSSLRLINIRDAISRLQYTLE